MLRLDRRIFAGVGLALALAVAGMGGIALADGTTPTSTPTTTTTTVQKTDYGQVFIAKLAAALGIDQAKLESAVKQAEVDTIDQAVADGNLAKNPADAMKQRVQQGTAADAFNLRGLGVGGRGDFGRGGPGGWGVGIVDQTVTQQAIADKLGLSVTDLQSQLQSGQTLASLAKAKNVQVQDLYDAAAAAAKPALDQAVKDGKITQAQADQIYQGIQQGRVGIGGAPGGALGGPKGGRGGH